MILPLVLLPGMMCDARLFAPQIAALEPRPTIVPALTGHDSMAALAAHVLAEAPPRFALAGLSMGGILAMEMLRQAPERVAALGLLDTNPRAELPEVQAGRALQIKVARADGLGRVMREQMIPHYLAPDNNRPGITTLCLRMALDLGIDAFVNQSRALRDRRDQQDVLRAVTVPTLVLCGRHDALCPLERHELMHDLIPGSSLVVIERAGHLPTLEQPEEVTAAIMDWLGTI